MEPFIGQIIMFAGTFAPRGWALCDGQIIQIAANQALFSILGTTYGGDGRTTFGLPDLRGRVPIHKGNGPGLSPQNLGQTSGSETHVLTTNQLPSHTHAVNASGTVSPKAKNGGGEETNPGDGFMASATTDLYAETSNTTMGASDLDLTVTVENTGGNSPVSNMQPTLCVNFIISLTGVFPSRS